MRRRDAQGSDGPTSWTFRSSRHGQHRQIGHDYDGLGRPRALTLRIAARLAEKSPQDQIAPCHKGEKQWINHRTALSTTLQDFGRSKRNVPWFNVYKVKLWTEDREELHELVERMAGCYGEQGTGSFVRVSITSKTPKPKRAGGSAACTFKISKETTTFSSSLLALSKKRETTQWSQPKLSWSVAQCREEGVGDTKSEWMAAVFKGRSEIRYQQGPSGSCPRSESVGHDSSAKSCGYYDRPKVIDDTMRDSMRSAGEDIQCGIYQPGAAQDVRA